MDKEQISREKFIRLRVMLGVGVGSASLLAACGGGGGSGGQTIAESSEGENEQNTTQASGPEVSKGGVIAEASEVPANSAKAFTDTGQAAVLVHLQSGDFAGYSAVCTHEGCLVSYQPQSQELACPCHGSVFDPARGAAVERGPAKSPLPQIGVTVENGEIIRA